MLGRIGVVCVLHHLILVNTPAQSKAYHLNVEGIVEPYSYQDSALMIQNANTVLVEWWRQGYVFAGIDSVFQRTIYVHRGDKISTTNVRLGYIDEYEDSIIFRGKKNNEQLWDVIDQELEEKGNSGHPFAQVRVNSINYDDEWNSELVIDPGPLIMFDTLISLNPIDIGKNYLHQALKITPGSTYSEKIYRSISQRLERMPFLRLRSQPDVTFGNGRAQVYLDLEESKSSSFEGVVGFLPGQSNTNDLVITGFLNLELANLLRSGKSLQFAWNRFADQSQSTKIAYIHPYLLSSPLFLQVDFNLLKQDTTFLNQSWLMESGTYLWNSTELFFGFSADNGSLIEPDELDLESGIADFKNRAYHIGLRSSYAYRPFEYGKRFKFALKAAIGEKRIVRNPSVSSGAYDTLALTTQKYVLNGLSRFQIPLKKQLALYHEFRAKLLFNQELLQNELERMGGLNSLRGFNENFFYARNYFLSRMELRQYFEKKSYIMLFYDVMYLRSFNDTQYPQGWGLGLNLNTSNGFFTFATAVGTAKNVPLNFTNVKVHLGYSSRF